MSLEHFIADMKLRSLILWLISLTMIYFIGRVIVKDATLVCAFNEYNNESIMVCKIK